MKYTDRLTAALQDALRDGLEVHVDHSIVSIRDPQTRSSALTFIPPEIDRRETVTTADISLILTRATGSLRSDIPKYKPEHVEPGRALLAELEAVAEGLV